MNTFVFQSSLTWRKTGFAFFSDSLSYREVLEANPSWDITKHPAPGTILFRPKTPGSFGLTQSSATISVQVEGSLDPNVAFPFSSNSDYNEALSRYIPEAVEEVQRLNGWSAV